MEHTLKIFDFNEHPVRVVIAADGEPRWIAKDVCDVLQIGNNRQALSRLDDDQKDDVILNDAIGREQTMNAVTESGLYELILRSDKPQAKAFRKWITAEVLPALRKTGRYALSNAPDPQTTVTVTKDALLQEGVRRLDRCEAQIDDLRALVAAQQELVRLYRARAADAEAALADDPRDADPRERTIDGRDYEKIVRLRAGGCSLESIARQMGRKLAVIEAALRYHNERRRDA